MCHIYTWWCQVRSYEHFMALFAILYFCLSIVINLHSPISIFVRFFSTASNNVWFFSSNHATTIPLSSCYSLYYSINSLFISWHPEYFIIYPIYPNTILSYSESSALFHFPDLFSIYITYVLLSFIINLITITIFSQHFFQIFFYHYPNHLHEKTLDLFQISLNLVSNRPWHQRVMTFDHLSWLYSPCRCYFNQSYELVIYTHPLHGFILL